MEIPGKFRGNVYGNSWQIYRIDLWKFLANLGTPIHGFLQVEEPFTASGSKHIWLKHLVAFGSNTHCLQHVATSTASGTPTHGLTCSQTQDPMGLHMP